MIKNIELYKAQQTLLNHICPIDAELISSSKSFGRIAANDIISPQNLPIAAQAAMDGFAIHEADLHSKTALNINKYLSSKQLRGLKIEVMIF